MKENFTVLKRGSCKIIYIPRGYCTIQLQNQAKDHIEISIDGDNMCIENVSSDLPCQKVNTEKGA